MHTKTEVSEKLKHTISAVKSYCDDKYMNIISSLSLPSLLEDSAIDLSIETEKQKIRMLLMHFNHTNMHTQTHIFEESNACKNSC